MLGEDIKCYEIREPLTQKCDHEEVTVKSKVMYVKRNDVIGERCNYL